MSDPTCPYCGDGPESVGTLHHLDDLREMGNFPAVEEWKLSGRALAEIGEAEDVRLLADAALEELAAKLLKFSRPPGCSYFERGEA